MTREEAIEVYNGLINEKIKAAFEFFVPELRESEDERIRKAVVSLVYEMKGTYQSFAKVELDKMVAWLEKQKEQKQDSLTKYVYSKEDKEFIQDCANILVANDYAASAERLLSMFDQKAISQEDFDTAKHEALWGEQKPAEKHSMAAKLKEHLANTPKEQLDAEWKELEKWNHVGPTVEEYFHGIKPAEWSEEDEKKRACAISLLQIFRDSGMAINPGFGKPVRAINKCIDWLKSLRPQPHKEIYQAAKHDLAIKFMNHLDENRPEGKMSLSNGECEDIDKAFKENDWAKIMRYVEKYRPSWKPSEEQMEALKELIDDANKAGWVTPGATELYENLKRL